MSFTFNEYQERAVATASYPDKGSNLLYPALGIAGEAGEIVDKIKKLWRNKGYTKASQLSSEEKTELVKEIGDELWYLAAFSEELGVPLGEVAIINLDKLADRQRRNVINSEGDNR